LEITLGENIERERRMPRALERDSQNKDRHGDTKGGGWAKEKKTVGRDDQRAFFYKIRRSKSFDVPFRSENDATFRSDNDATFRSDSDAVMVWDIYR